MQSTAKGFSTSASRSFSLSSTYRRGVFKTLAPIKDCYLEVEDGSGVERFGTRGHELHAKVKILDPAMYRRIALRGTIGVAESYMENEWTCDNLVHLVQIFCRNRDVMNAMESGLANLVKPLLRGFHYLNRDTRDQSKKNIEAHYDLGNEFFSKFLDSTMMYSSAIFAGDDNDLAAASNNKLSVLFKKLDLKPHDHLLEIGSGWGSCAIQAAQKYGCKVTTTTLSKAQFQYVAERIKTEKMQGQVTVLLQDYRDLQGKFSKLVSVEMVEAVGLQYLDTYMKKCSDLLTDDGIFVLQGITMRDQLFDYASKNVDFIQRYIFPGSAIPSISVLLNAAAKSSEFVLCDAHDITVDYAKTLKIWRESFVKAKDEMTRLKFSQKFQRMWEYYFAYCEGGFRERVIGCYQFVLLKPRAIPPVMNGRF